jgi:hypothetical protein
MTLAINNDLMTVNAATPGLIGSATDFGFNNKGIMFNETTHRMDRSDGNQLPGIHSGADGFAVNGQPSGPTSPVRKIVARRRRRCHGQCRNYLHRSCQSALRIWPGDVPLFVEICEAVAAV